MYMCVCVWALIEGLNWTSVFFNYISNYIGEKKIKCLSEYHQIKIRISQIYTLSANEEHRLMRL